VVTELSEDPRLRFRVWVAAVLVEEVWLDATDPLDRARIDGVRDRHMAIADAAEADGKLWLVEVYDPALGQFGYMRFGTDTAGMVDPLTGVQE
jgi:hypothetical protein